MGAASSAHTASEGTNQATIATHRSGIHVPQAQQNGLSSALHIAAKHIPGTAVRPCRPDSRLRQRKPADQNKFFAERQHV